MTRFTDIFKGNASTDLNSAFGETITYTPDGGEGKSITARVQRESVRPEYMGDGRKYESSARVIILRDATAGIASPAIGDSVTFDSVTWDVSGIETQNAASTTLIVHRTVDVEKSKQTHRL